MIGTLTMITLASKPWSDLTFSKSMGELWRDLNTCWCGSLLAFTNLILKLFSKPTIRCPSAGSPMLHPLSSMLELQGPRLETFLWNPFRNDFNLLDVYMLQEVPSINYSRYVGLLCPKVMLACCIFDYPHSIVKVRIQLVTYIPTSLES